MLALACSSMTVKRRYFPVLPFGGFPFNTRPRSVGTVFGVRGVLYGTGRLPAARVLTPAVEAELPNGSTMPPPTTTAPPTSSSRRLMLMVLVLALSVRSLPAW